MCSKKSDILEANFMFELVFFTPSRNCELQIAVNCIDSTSLITSMSQIQNSELFYLVTSLSLMQLMLQGVERIADILP